MISAGHILKESIKCVGVGKRGSKELSPEMIQDLISVLSSSGISQVSLGAFVGALVMKGLTDKERELERVWGRGIFEDPVRLVQRVASDVPVGIREICIRLLKGETLDESAAELVGGFLMGDDAGDGARGMIASILRVRYETPEEYTGILRAVGKTFQKPFCRAIPAGCPVIQMAEPFDGVDHSCMITPLVADFLQNQGYRVVSLCGRSGGPKFGNNLQDVARILDAVFLKSSVELKDPLPAFGFYLDQKDLSPAMDRWVDLRHQIVKRPFMATIERFVNPFQADICIASAFHPPYGEKMLSIAERAGFSKVIIIRNGMEGTMAFALKRATKMLCSVRKADGSYQRHDLAFDPERFLESVPAVEEVLQNPSPEDNADLIRSFQVSGKSGREHFDLRVKVTCAGLAQALESVNL